MAAFYEINFTSSALEGWAMVTRFVYYKPIMIDDKEMSMCSSRESNILFELQILSVLEGTDGYSYKSKYRNVGSSRYMCKRNNFQKQNAGLREHKRVRYSIQEFLCKGYVKFCYSLQAVATIEVFHCISHEGIREFPMLTLKDTEEINILAGQGLLPFQIRQQLIKSNSINLTYNQVYCQWHKSVKKQYFQDVDLKISVLRLTNMEPSLTCICHNSSPFYVGFIPTNAAKWTGKFDIHEIFIDSTFKTNAEKLEVFAVIGKVVGFGIPLTYFLLNHQKLQLLIAKKHFANMQFVNFSSLCVTHFHN